MIEINLKSLIEKMTPAMRDSLERAAGLCMAQSHYNVEIEHWLLALLDQFNHDAGWLLTRFEVDQETLKQQLMISLEHFQGGSTRPPALAPALVNMVQQGWLLGSVDFGQGLLTTAHCLTALLLQESSRHLLLTSVPSLSPLVPQSVRELAKTSPLELATTAGLVECSTARDSPTSKTPCLDQYTVNLTQQAQEGALDPVLGRDQEIRQCIDILVRRRQNNPILTGEAGVGKTAVVEGLALRIAAGDVPGPLQEVSIRTLDLALLQAGASVKGEFEKRLKAVIEEVRQAPTPIILFIDEAHTLIGAGGAEGQGDAANLLKPALARGELRTVAATTWAEYKKYFERDPALTRRFQVIKVEEPSEDLAITMLRGIAKHLQNHHQVRILNSAIVAAVKLSHRYIPARQLPDKAVSLLDTACARVALSQSSTPAAIEDYRRQLATDRANFETLQREHFLNNAHGEALGTLEQQMSGLEHGLIELEQQWQQEQTLVSDILQRQAQLEAGIGGDESASRLAHLQALQLQLESLQGEGPLLQVAVDESAVAEVVANWTGIPLGKMVNNEIQSILNLEKQLQERVIGQPTALAAVAKTVQSARAGLTDPRRPLGVFLFVGPSGVGKTETALALADTLYGGEQCITTINMSEFKEAHKVSMLLGSPPGYVGYGEGGVLTEAARRKPYSIILLDEMEKAHPEVQDIFYNLFDKGSIKDGEGRDIDFKNTLIVMTSNAGDSAIQAYCEAQGDSAQEGDLMEYLRPVLLDHFKPAFLGRTQVVAFKPLGQESLLHIARLGLERVAKRVKGHYGAQFHYDESLLDTAVARGLDRDTGARSIEQWLNNAMLPGLAVECLDRLSQGKGICNVHASFSQSRQFVFQIDG